MTLKSDAAVEAPKPDDGGPECPQHIRHLIELLEGRQETRSSFWAWAATALKVPTSGDKRLDDMIRESQRWGLVELFLQAFLVQRHADPADCDYMTRHAQRLADAVLAESGKRGDDGKA